MSQAESSPQDKSILLSVLKNKKSWPPPIWLMRQAGRYLPEYRRLRLKANDFLDFCYTPDLVFEATLQPVKRFDFDAAILFSDILVIPDALGQKVSFSQNPRPVMDPIQNLDDLLPTDPQDWLNRLKPVYEAMTRVRQFLPPKKALIGFSGAPWTLACYMIEGQGKSGFVRACKTADSDPDFMSGLIDRLCTVIVFHLHRQIESGADCVQIFDSWAGLVHKNKRQFDRCCVEPVARIVREVKKSHPHTPIIAFPRGIGSLYVDYVRKTGIDAVSLDTEISPQWASTYLQNLCPVQGNIDPETVQKGGRLLDHSVDHLIETLGKKPWIVNLGHGILPHTRMSHVQSLIKRIRASSPP